MPRITIPMTRTECEELIEGNEHNWTIHGIKVHLVLEEEENEEDFECDDV